MRCRLPILFPLLFAASALARERIGDDTRIPEDLDTDLKFLNQLRDYKYHIATEFRLGDLLSKNLGATTNEDQVAVQEAVHEAYEIVRITGTDDFRNLLQESMEYHVRPNPTKQPSLSTTVRNTLLEIEKSVVLEGEINIFNYVDEWNMDNRLAVILSKGSENSERNRDDFNLALSKTLGTIREEWKSKIGEEWNTRSTNAPKRSKAKRLKFSQERESRIQEFRKRMVELIDVEHHEHLETFTVLLNLQRLRDEILQNKFSYPTATDDDSLLADKIIEEPGLLVKDALEIQDPVDCAERKNKVRELPRCVAKLIPKIHKQMQRVTKVIRRKKSYPTATDDDSLPTDTIFREGGLLEIGAMTDDDSLPHIIQGPGLLELEATDDDSLEGALKIKARVIQENFDLARNQITFSNAVKHERWFAVCKYIKVSEGHSKEFEAAFKRAMNADKTGVLEELLEQPTVTPELITTLLKEAIEQYRRMIPFLLKSLEDEGAVVDVIEEAVKGVNYVSLYLSYKAFAKSGLVNMEFFAALLKKKSAEEMAMIEEATRSPWTFPAVF